VIPDDIKALAESALAHRLIIKTSSSMHDIDPRQVIAELLNTVPSTTPRWRRDPQGAPVERPRRRRGAAPPAARLASATRERRLVIRRLQFLIVAVVC
jgi:hypothetical protein